MGFIIDENAYVNQTAFEFEKKLNSPFVRLIDETPQPCGYWNISDPDTTIDDGLYSVERPLGSHSPYRFNYIEDLPIYMDSNVLLDLQDDEEGLTTSFEADGKIMPGTVLPYAGDYFYIKYLGKKFIFRINEISYDTLKSYNYYKISFSIKTVDSMDTYNDLMNQTVNEFQCIIRNIGTDEKCIMEKSDYLAIMSLNRIYDHISDMYMTNFYDPLYNTILYEDNEGRKVYDRYLTNFINKNYLLYQKFNYKATILAEIDFDKKFLMSYNNSPYKMMELDRLRTISNRPYILSSVRDMFCIFKLYNDTRVFSLELMDKNVGDWYLPFDGFSNPKMEYLNKVDTPLHNEDIMNKKYIPPVFSRGPSMPGLSNHIDETNWDKAPLIKKDKEEDNKDSNKDNKPPISDNNTKDIPKRPYNDMSSEDIDLDNLPNRELDKIYTDISPDDGEEIDESLRDIKPYDILDINLKILRNYFNSSLEKITDLPVKQLKDIQILDTSWDTFISIPILLYVIKRLYKEFMAKEEKPEWLYDKV